MATDRQVQNGGMRFFLVLLGSLGLLLQFADIFMVPGYFNLEMALSVLAMFFIGLVIAVIAGAFYVRANRLVELGVRTVMRSLPVVVFCLGTGALFVLGFLSYNPPPKGH